MNESRRNCGQRNKQWPNEKNIEQITDHQRVRKMSEIGI